MAEWQHSILFAPPGPLKEPDRTLDQIRAEHRKRDERSAHALALVKAGFGKLAVAWLVSNSVDAVEPIEAGSQPPPPSTEASAIEPSSGVGPSGYDSGSAAIQTAALGLAEALQHTKDKVSISERISNRNPAQDVDPSPFSSDPAGQSVPETVSAHTLEGLSDTVSDSIQAPTSPPKRTRRRPPTPRKKTKKASKPKRLKTISYDRHEEAVTAYLVAQALGSPFNVALDFNPGIDHLDHAARLRFWAALLVNIASYIRGRCIVRGKPFSWWKLVFLGARESDPRDSSGEHLNGMIFVPDVEEFRHLLKHLDKMRKKDRRIWCHDIVANRIDAEQRIDGRKIGSRLDYVLKNAHRDTRAKYPYMIYERSGFITGERVMISKNLTDPKVVASVERGVAMHRRLREERRSILIAEILRRDAQPPYPWE